MEKSNTKNDILEAALELFSVQGYEATSLSQIAEAVGIRKASVYSHFESKQKILDALTSGILEQYDKHSIFSQVNLSDPEFQKRIGGISPDEISEMILKHIRYILHDPHISKSRKMLTVEQFRNPELQKLQTNLWLKLLKTKWHTTSRALCLWTKAKMLRQERALKTL